MNRCLAAASLMLAVACSGSSTADSPAMCATRADSVAAKLRLFGGDAPRISSTTNPIPASKVGLAPHVRGPVVLIDGTLVTYNNQRIDPDASALAARHKAERKRHAIYARGSLPPVYVHASPKTPMARLVSLLEPLKAEPSLRLLVQQTRVGRGDSMAGASTRVKELVASIKAMPASAAASQLAKEMEKAIGSCSSVIKLFGDVASADATRKTTLIVDQIALRLRGCNCQLTDLDAFEYLLLSVVDVGDTVQLYVPFSLIGAGTTVEMPGASTVADLVTRFKSLPEPTVHAGIALRVK